MSRETNSPSRGLHIGLWVVQILLGLMFAGVGLMKTSTPLAELAENLPWVTELPRLVRVIGVSEFLGGVGMILPAATRIQPRLTGLAGIGLATVMVLATIFHISRGEPEVIPVNLVLGSLAAFVAWGRLVRAPIEKRT